MGIYSGTFDPIHRGHLALARLAYEQGKLSKVVILMDKKPRRKTGVTELTHRQEICKLVADENEWLEVKLLDEDEFTISETLPKLQKLYGKDLVFIMGSDVFEHLAQWQNYQKLTESSKFIIGLRGHDESHIEDVSLETGAEFMVIKNLPEISSSKIREDFKKYQTDITNPAANYIKQNKLYNA